MHTCVDQWECSSARWGRNSDSPSAPSSCYILLDRSNTPTYAPWSFCFAQGGNKQRDWGWGYMLWWCRVVLFTSFQAWSTWRRASEQNPQMALDGSFDTYSPHYLLGSSCQLELIRSRVVLYHIALYYWNWFTRYECMHGPREHVPPSKCGLALLEEGIQINFMASLKCSPVYSDPPHTSW